MSDLARIRFARQGLASPSPFDWMDDAACRDSDPGFWDTDRAPDPTIARTICAGCPVIAACAVAAKSFTAVGDDGKKRKTRATHCIWAGVDMRKAAS